MLGVFSERPRWPSSAIVPTNRTATPLTNDNPGRHLLVLELISSNSPTFTPCRQGNYEAEVTALSRTGEADQRLAPPPLEEVGRAGHRRPRPLATMLKEHISLMLAAERADGKWSWPPLGRGRLQEHAVTFSLSPLTRKTRQFCHESSDSATLSSQKPGMTVQSVLG